MLLDLGDPLRHGIGPGSGFARPGLGGGHVLLGRRRSHLRGVGRRTSRVSVLLRPTGGRVSLLDVGASPVRVGTRLFGFGPRTPGVRRRTVRVDLCRHESLVDRTNGFLAVLDRLVGGAPGVGELGADLGQRLLRVVQLVLGGLDPCVRLLELHAEPCLFFPALLCRLLRFLGPRERFLGLRDRFLDLHAQSRRRVSSLVEGRERVGQLLTEVLDRRRRLDEAVLGEVGTVRDAAQLCEAITSRGEECLGRFRCLGRIGACLQRCTEGSFRRGQTGGQVEELTGVDGLRPDGRCSQGLELRHASSQHALRSKGFLELDSRLPKARFLARLVGVHLDRGPPRWRAGSSFFPHIGAGGAGLRGVSGSRVMSVVRR